MANTKKAPKRIWKKVILTVLLVLVGAFIAYDIVQAATLPARIKLQLLTYPDDSHAHYGMCGTGIQITTQRFKWSIFGAAPETTIPLLHWRPPYLRQAVHQNLETLGPLAMPAIWVHYTFGDARTRLELYDYVFPEGPIEGKFHLLNKIIKNRRLDVFAEDSRLVRESWHGTGPPALPDDYTVDIVTYYKRLVVEADYATDRAVAVGMLSKYDLDASEFVPLFSGLLDEPDEHTQSQMVNREGPSTMSLHGIAIYALGEFGPEAIETAPRIMEIFDQGDPYLSTLAAATLYLIGYEQEEMLQYLSDEFESYPVQFPDDAYSQKSTCNEVIANIGRIGPGAIDTLPGLIEHAVDGDPIVRWNARWAARRVEGSDDTVLRILADQLRSGDQELITEAANALYFMRDADITIAVPAMLERIQVTDSHEMRRLCHTLIRRGEYIDEVVAEIVKMVEEEREGYDQVFMLLKILGEDASAAIPTAKRMIESDDSGKVFFGAQVFLPIGGDVEYLVSELTDNLSHHDPDLVNISIRNLGAIGPDASSALPLLEQLTRSPNDQTARYANEAVTAIRNSL